MTATYELRFFTTAGVEIARLGPNPSGDDITRSGFIQLAYTNQVNTYGLCSFVLPGNHSLLPSLTERVMVEVWRADPEHGIAIERDWSGLFLDERRWWDKSKAQHLYKAMCYSDAYKLTDRIVNWRAATTNRSTFAAAKAETVLKTLATYNLTASASVVNGRIVDGTMTGVSVQADGANGNNVDIAFAWDNLLAAMQAVAKKGGGDFDLVKTGAATWEYRWYTGQRGTDRHATILFSTDRGNMGDPIYEKIRSEKRTSITVGGQGQEGGRLIVNRQGNGYTATLNFEEFYNASGQTTDATGLNLAGDKRLGEVQDVESFSFHILPTESLVYKRDYFLGDLVTASYLGISTEPKIISVAVGLDENGQEKIEPELSYAA